MIAAAENFIIEGGKRRVGRRRTDDRWGERWRGGSTITQITWHCSGWTRVIITMDARCLCQSDKTIQLWPCKMLTLCQLLLQIYCRFKFLYLLQTHTKAVPCVALLPKMIFWHVDLGKRRSIADGLKCSEEQNSLAALRRTIEESHKSL